MKPRVKWRRRSRSGGVKSEIESGIEGSKSKWRVESGVEGLKSNWRG